jgi:hypothetical protein
MSSNEMTDAEKIAAAASERRSVSPRPSGPGSSFDWAGPTPVAPEQQRSSTPFSLSRYGRYSGKRGSRAPTIIPRDAPITQADLIASAERIFGRYLIPTAEKEIYLPPSLRIHTFLLSSEHPPDPNSSDYDQEASAMAQVPDMFHAQKEYIFKAMEQDAFPRFLRSKAFGNLTPMSVLVRLIAGLLILWAGLSTAFALIFLDIQPKSVRFWVRVSPLLVMPSHLPLFPPTAVHTLFLGGSLPNIVPVRARSDPHFLSPIRDDALPHAHHPRAVREEAPYWPCYLGDRPCVCPEYCFDTHLLGRTWPPTLILRNRGHTLLRSLTTYVLRLALLRSSVPQSLPSF